CQSGVSPSGNWTEWLNSAGQPKVFTSARMPTTAAARPYSAGARMRTRTSIEPKLRTRSSPCENTVHVIPLATCDRRVSASIIWAGPPASSAPIGSRRSGMRSHTAGSHDQLASAGEPVEQPEQPLAKAPVEAGQDEIESARSKRQIGTPRRDNGQRFRPAEFCGLEA